MWVELPDGTDVDALFAAAAERGVAFVKGTDFLLDGGRNTLRLAYSGVTADQIDEGVARLAEAYRQQSKQATSSARASMSAALAGFALGFAVAAGFGPISVLALTSGLRHGLRAGVRRRPGRGARRRALRAARRPRPRGPGPRRRAAARGRRGASVDRLADGARGGGDGMALATFGRGLGVSFAATLANPLTIVSWAAAFTAVVPGLGVSRTGTLAVLAPCVALGTLTWFTGLALAASFAGRRLGPRALRVASVVAGLAIGAFGLVFVVRGVLALV
jgi:threonine/homoserine/homoserine lactone efflux protein